MLRSIGADHVFDYTQGDITESGQRYDLIFDVIAYRSVADYERILSPEGVYVVVGGSLSRILQASLTGGERMRNLSAKLCQEDLAYVRSLLGAGTVVPVIDRCYPLEGVPEALRYYGDRHTQGKVVITVQDSGA